MKTNQQRLNNIVGQMNGIGKMMDANDDPIKVLTQMRAARSALNSLMSRYVQEHFWEFINSCSDKEESCRKFFEEIIEAN